MPAGGTAVASLVWCNHMKSRPGQRQYHLSPAVGQLRETVQQQHPPLDGLVGGLIKTGLQNVHIEAIGVRQMA